MMSIPNPCSHFLNLLDSTHTTQQRALIKTLSPEQLRTLCEILLNIVEGTLDISSYVKNYFKRKSRVIKRLLNKNTSKKNKQSLLLKNIKLLKYIIKTFKERKKTTLLQNEQSTTEICCFT